MKSSKRKSPSLLSSTIDRSTNLPAWIWPLVLIVVAILVLRPSLYANSEALPAPAEGTAAHPVQVIAARISSDPPVVRLPSVLRARERSDLAFLHSGRLAERRVELGQAVVADEILAVLHNPTLMPGADAAAAQAREARFNLDQVEREVVRLRDLHQRNLVPTEELERIVARRDAADEALKQAEAALEEAREQLDEAMLRAPFAGIVAGLMAEPGQFVSAGQSVLALVGMRTGSKRSFACPSAAQRSANRAIARSAASTTRAPASTTE